ncbi:MAG TPA: carbohydrate kinase family protein [Prolixibacteraceae bacterium]|nr:carbohydrate kinase family protein [Prolixibacteraceae bacterium]HCU59868.1 carbohydrate kinase family protein [Prolixibacteraceae bacterium]
MSKKIIVSGVGCCLVDILYKDIDFASDPFLPFLSLKRGDGGLTPGHLVFNEEFVEFAGLPFETVITKITGGRKPDKKNIGGPSIVSLIHAAQLTDPEHCEIRFYGRCGNDDAGKYLLYSLQKTPVILYDFKHIENITPSTVVLSDSSYDNGHGERIFINSIGAARDFAPDDLDDDFFNSDIVVFGGTALVPSIHDNLTGLLRKVKRNGSITVVNTVFDFRNEKLNAGQRWPLGNSDESYQYTDLLIANNEEALRLSGESTAEAAIRFFRERKVPALIITNGSKNITVYSNGQFFEPLGLTEMPVSQKVTDELKHNKNGDTTGCGDNFVGGVIASIVNQIQKGIKQPDILEACCWGIVSGGFACFYMGGTYLEKKAGEKLNKIKTYYEAYIRQIKSR